MSYPSIGVPVVFEIAKLYPLFWQGCVVHPSTQSSSPAAFGSTEFPDAGNASLVNASAYPIDGYVIEYVVCAVLMVRNDETADASFADILLRRKFGIAIAAMTRMIATTISNSMSENPDCLRTRVFSPAAHILRRRNTLSYIP